MSEEQWQRIAIIPAQAGEQAAVIWSKDHQMVIVPVVAWRIMLRPEMDEGEGGFVAKPIAAHFSLDDWHLAFAVRMADGRWHAPIHEETFNTAEQFLAAYKREEI